MKGNRLHECPVCHKYFQSLGIARHRAMHTDAARKKAMEAAATNRQQAKPEKRPVNVGYYNY